MKKKNTRKETNSYQKKNIIKPTLTANKNRLQIGKLLKKLPGFSVLKLRSRFKSMRKIKLYNKLTTGKGDEGQLVGSVCGHRGLPEEEGPHQSGLLVVVRSMVARGGLLLVLLRGGLLVLPTVLVEYGHAGFNHRVHHRRLNVFSMKKFQ